MASYMNLMRQAHPFGATGLKAESAADQTMYQADSAQPLNHIHGSSAKQNRRTRLDAAAHETLP